MVKISPTIANQNLKRAEKNTENKESEVSPANQARGACKDVADEGGG